MAVRRASLASVSNAPRQLHLFPEWVGKRGRRAASVAEVRRRIEAVHANHEEQRAAKRPPVEPAEWEKREMRVRSSDNQFHNEV